jgi:hypothetical protein
LRWGPSLTPVGAATLLGSGILTPAGFPSPAAIFGSA